MNNSYPGLTQLWNDANGHPIADAYRDWLLASRYRNVAAYAAAEVPAGAERAEAGAAAVRELSAGDDGDGSLRPLRGHLEADQMKQDELDAIRRGWGLGNAAVYSAAINILLMQIQTVNSPTLREALMKIVQGQTKAQKDVENLLTEIERLRAENGALRAELEYYANPEAPAAASSSGAAGA